MRIKVEDLVHIFTGCTQTITTDEGTYIGTPGHLLQSISQRLGINCLHKEDFAAHFNKGGNVDTLPAYNCSTLPCILLAKSEDGEVQHVEVAIRAGYRSHIETRALEKASITAINAGRVQASTTNHVYDKSYKNEADRPGEPAVLKVGRLEIDRIR